METINGYKKHHAKKSLKIIILVTSLIIISVVQPIQICSSINTNNNNINLGNKSQFGLANWTLMLYMAGDNNLDPNQAQDLDTLKAVGSGNGVNAIVLSDSSGSGDTHAYYVERYNLVTIPLTVLNSTWTNEVNMGDENTLECFVKYCIDNYPAKKYLLGLINHGHGWEGTCYDDSSGKDRLRLDELGRVLSKMCGWIGHKVDVIWFDACLMSCTEIVWDLAPYVSYMASSESVGWTSTYNYQKFFSYIKSNPKSLPRDIAVYINDQAGTCVDNSTYVTQAISSLDLGYTHPFVEALEEFILSLFDVIPTNLTAIQDARNLCKSYYWNHTLGQYIDLYDFAENIKSKISDTTVQNAAQSLIDSIGSSGSTGKLVMIERHTAATSFSHGVSIFYPTNLPELNRINYTSTTEFGAHSQWVSFLCKLYSISVPSTPNPDDLINGWTNITTRTFTWNVPPGPSIAGYQWSVDNGSIQNTPSTSVDLLPQPTGLHWFSVRAVDSNGNYGLWGRHVFGIDIDLPFNVLIISPTSGEHISGKKYVYATANDNSSGISLISFYVDNSLQYNDSIYPYDWNWSTTAFTDGQYTLKVIAYDFVNNSQEFEIIVIIDNASVTEMVRSGLLIISLLAASVVFKSIIYFGKKSKIKE